MLAHNYDQTLALSLMEARRGRASSTPTPQFMADLEAAGRLDRAVEGLPDAAAIAERAPGRQGPDPAGAGGAAGLRQARAVSARSSPPTPRTTRSSRRLLEAYFPKRAAQVRRARCAATGCGARSSPRCVANDIDQPLRPDLPEPADAGGRRRRAAPSPPAIEAAKAVLGIPALWDAVAALDGKAPAAGPDGAVPADCAAALRGQTFWLARRAARDKLGRRRPGRAPTARLRRAC